MTDAWRSIELAFTGTVALFTIVLAVVSIEQGDTARKAVRRATQSAEAALRAAKATERSNEIAAEALRQTKLRERSTLVIEDFKIRNFPSAPRLSFCVKNVGEQPASQIAINGPLSGMELMKRKSQASRRPELGFRPGAVGPGANGIRGQVFRARRDWTNISAGLAALLRFSAYKLANGHTTESEAKRIYRLSNHCRRHKWRRYILGGNAGLLS